MTTATFGYSPRTASHLRITSRGRAVLLTLVAGPLVLVAIALGMNAGGATATSQVPTQQLQTVIVLPGESLWSVAEHVAPNVDPREFISDIVRLNGLDSAAVQAGQQLEIPAEYATGK